ncbi:hypothetical protein [Sphingomonas sp. LT1P40]|uniref:hypothetical protein n=1 Tax=Alteristakelama amylovorans TaxID=3096166 RepID=UPI002FCBCECA
MTGATLNPWLMAAGVANTIAALLHAGCIVGGANWYRFFGAGERMARMVERGLILPHIYTAIIVLILTGWAAFAFSGAGLIGRLPLLRVGLAAISTIYLARAILGPFLLVSPDRSATFLWISSAIVLVIGLLHAIGTAQIWNSAGR